MLNRCEFIGNLGRDPEVRHTQSGDKVVNLQLAVTERWKKDGEQKERTEWVRCVIWNQGLAKVAEAYLSKGSRCYIAGQMQTRQWEKDGAKQYTTEIVLNFDGKLVLLDRKQDSGDQAYSTRAKEQWDGKSGGGDLDDEIPF